MDFFEKLGNAAKTAGEKLSGAAKGAADKASGAIEITKINSKIGTENNKINGFKNQIGQYYWQQYQAGALLPSEIGELCQSIAKCEEAIVNYQAEINALKSRSNADDDVEFEIVDAAIVCPACGTVNNDNQSFCSDCGQKLKGTTETKVADNICKGCGFVNTEGSRFCSSCGTAL